MAGRFSNPNYQFFDENGDPLAGGKLEFFESGTSTPQDTFSDDALTVPNTNPKILDSAGRAGDIFFTSSDYKVVLKKADDTVVWTADPVRSPTPKSTAVVAVSAATTVSTGDDGALYAADATSGGFLITLPAAADAGNGFEWSAIKVDSTTNTVTVDANGSETINGELDYTLSQQWATVTLRCDGAEWYVTAESVSRENAPFDPKHLEGLTLENGGTPASEVSISPGSARDTDDGGNILLSSSITKRLNAAFSEGNNQGGLDTGTVAADTTYYVFAIGKTDGTADVLFSTSETSPSVPGGFSFKRRIGSLRTDSSSNIIVNQFSQVYEDEEVYLSLAQDPSTKTSQDFLDLPSSIQELVISWADASVSGSSRHTIRLGDATGGFANSGYVGTTETSALSTGFITITVGAAAVTASGSLRFTRIDKNKWAAEGTSARTDNPQNFSIAGNVLLQGELDRIQYTTENGTDTLDSCEISVRAVSKTR